MKKLIGIVIALAAISVFLTCAYALPIEEVPAELEGTDVLAVFAAVNKQPRPLFNDGKQNLDTIWIFHTDGTFRQYVFMDGTIQLYSEGDFACEDDRTDFDRLTIHRTRKHMEGAGFQNYSSIHGYTLYGGEYARLDSPEKTEAKVSAVYWSLADDERAPADCRILYADGTFTQYAREDGQYRFSREGTWQSAQEGLLIDGETQQNEDAYVLLLKDQE